MIANFLTFLSLLFLSFWIAQILSDKFGKHHFPVLRNLIFYHVILSIVYYIYAINNPSDSWAYYDKVITNFRGPTWLDFYGISTPFIEFIGYPFIKYFQLPYESIMMIFAWFGLLGFFFFYFFLKECIRTKLTLWGFDLVLIVIFLPNPHFWAASFGKGSIIFLGIGLFFFGILKVNRRFIAIIIGALIIYHVRPHILFIVLVASAIGFTFSTRGINWAMRIAVITLAMLAFGYIYTDVLNLIGFEEQELLEESTRLTQRVKGLTRANSGVDITQYSFPMKLFTFIFRPLFVDATGVLGIIVSFENLFYLVMFSKIIRVKFFSFFVNADYIVKTAFISFFGVSAALAQISANLGLAMRQKSQVMILMMFVILKFLDEQKKSRVRSTVSRKNRLKLKIPINPRDSILKSQDSGLRNQD